MVAPAEYQEGYYKVKELPPLPARFSFALHDDAPLRAFHQYVKERPLCVIRKGLVVHEPHALHASKMCGFKLIGGRTTIPGLAT